MKSINLGRAGLAATGLALLLLSGCGGGESSSDQPTSEERRKLDNIAAKADEAETVDTSPDSLVLNEGAADAGNTSAADGSPPPPGNGAANSTTQR